MSAREVTELRRLLDAVGESAARVSRRLEVLHSVAFDRQVSDEVRVAASREGWSLDGVGDERAKRAWSVLSAAVLHAARQFEAAALAADRVLSAGDGPGVLRGTLLGRDPGTYGRGDPGESASVELERAVARQRERLARGEFDPGRGEPQPRVPRR